MLVAAGNLRAQTPTFSPTSFTAQDQVTLTIDISNTPIAGIDQAYIWIWANPGGVGPGPNGLVDGDWTNSSEDAKMTLVSPNVWSYTFTGTTLFGLAPADLHDFGFLVKAKDGSGGKQTQDFKPFKFDPLVFTPTMLRIFPAKVDTSDVVTLNFDQSLAVTTNEQRMSPVSATITMFDEAGTQVGSPLTINVANTGGTIWSGSFIPSESFTASAGHSLKKFQYVFNGTILDPSGLPTTVSSSSTAVDFTPMK